MPFTWLCAGLASLQGKVKFAVSSDKWTLGHIQHHKKVPNFLWRQQRACMTPFPFRGAKREATALFLWCWGPRYLINVLFRPFQTMLEMNQPTQTFILSVHAEKGKDTKPSPLFRSLSPHTAFSSTLRLQCLLPKQTTNGGDSRSRHAAWCLKAHRCAQHCADNADCVSSGCCRCLEKGCSFQPRRHWRRHCPCQPS